MRGWKRFLNIGICIFPITPQSKKVKGQITILLCCEQTLVTRKRCQNRCQMVAAAQCRKRIFSTVAATLPNDCDRKFSNSKTVSRATFPQRFPGNGLATFPGQLFGNHLATMVAQKSCRKRFLHDFYATVHDRNDRIRFL